MKTRWFRNIASILAYGLLATSMLWAREASAQVRIMPLGDSLTSSLDGLASYRYWLWQKLQAGGYQVEFVGTQWGVGDGVSGIYPDFQQNHEGIPGATTYDILAGIPGWAQQTQPDIVLLLIGANDLESGIPASQVVSNTHQIIEALRSVNPNVAVLLAMLPPISGLKPKEQAFNSGILRSAPGWSQPNSPIRLVNLWSGFSIAKDTVDGQHPNAAGEQIYAKRFYKQLVPILARFGQ